MKIDNGNGMLITVFKEFEVITIKNLSRQQKVFFLLVVFKRELRNVFQKDKFQMPFFGLIAENN